MIADGRNCDQIAPGAAAIGGGEGLNAVAFKRNDHGAVGLHDGLTAESEGVANVDARAPGLAPVGGCAHFFLIADSRVIPLDVAVSEEGASGVVITDDPIFVGERTLIVDGNGVIPGDAAI